MLYAGRLGYDPNEAVTAHQRLEVAVEKYLKRAGSDSRSGGFLNEILSTHPRKEVRIEEIQAMINELPPYRLRADGKFSDDFLRMTRSIRKVNEAYLLYDDAERAFDKKSYNEASRMVKKAIDMNSQQAPFYSLLGKIAFVKENYVDAADNFNKALERENSYQPAYYGLAISEYKRKRPGAALEYIKKSLSLYPDHPGSLYVSGLCYHEMDRPREALDYFGKFVELVNRHAEVYGYMGINYEKLNNTRMAIKAYSAQVEIAPDNEMGRYAQQRLALLRGPFTP